MLIFYVVGCPVAAFIILYTNRNQLDKPEVLKYIILLYQGLKHEMFYWELVNTLRKCLLLSFHVFIPDTLKTMKALFGVLTMFVISLAQSRLKPFKIEVISTLENREMVASLLTLYGGLIFSQKEQELSLLSIIFFILIILANCRFLILWIFWVSTVYKNKKVAELFGKWIKRAFCIKVNEDDEDFLWYRSKLTTSYNSKNKSKDSRFTSMVSKNDKFGNTKNTILKKTRMTILNNTLRDPLPEQTENGEDTIRTPKKLIKGSALVTDTKRTKRSLMDPNKKQII